MKVMIISHDKVFGLNSVKANWKCLEVLFSTWITYLPLFHLKAKLTHFTIKLKKNMKLCSLLPTWFFSALMCYRHKRKMKQKNSHCSLWTNHTGSVTSLLTFRNVCSVRLEELQKRRWSSWRTKFSSSPDRSCCKETLHWKVINFVAMMHTTS